MDTEEPAGGRKDGREEDVVHTRKPTTLPITCRVNDGLVGPFGNQDPDHAKDEPGRYRSGAFLPMPPPPPPNPEEKDSTCAKPAPPGAAPRPEKEDDIMEPIRPPPKPNPANGSAKRGPPIRVDSGLIGGGGGGGAAAAGWIKGSGGGETGKSVNIVFCFGSKEINYSTY